MAIPISDSYESETAVLLPKAVRLMRGFFIARIVELTMR